MLRKIKMNKQLRMVSAHHDWWSKTYDNDYFEHFGLYHRVTMDNIRRYLPVEKGAIILDAGGGTGIWSVELAKMGYDVVLTDISQQMLGEAKKKISVLDLDDKVMVVVSNICQMSEFRDQQFSMVLCEGDPLSYCGDHHAAIKELIRVVRSGGIVIASVDNRVKMLKSLRETEDLNEISRFLEEGDVMMQHGQEEFRYVVHAFTPEELKELFEANGLSVERIIGKPVIAHRLPPEIADVPQLQDWLYSLEIKFNSDPACYPWGGHLEIVGRKR
jgi:ubiquinone/menaquinone biosynthesis C-methylase UbiE